MKSSYYMRHIVAIAMLFALLLLSASAKMTHAQIAQSQIIGVGQAIDGTMQPAALGGLHVTFTYSNLGGNPVFLNIWAQMPNQTNFAWVAMNICLSPYNGTRLLERSISLHQLGIPNNVRIPAIMLSAQQSNAPLINPVMPSNFNLYNCPLDSVFMFDSPTNEFAGPGGPDYVAADFAGPIQASVTRGCTVPNIDLDDAANPGVKKGYAGDKNACGPAAVANSLEWLQAATPAVLSDGLTPRQRLEELSELMGRNNRGDGVSKEEMIQGKVAFVAKYKLKIKVEYHAASGDFDEDKNWLKAQYDAGQDVELDYSYIDEQGDKKSHAVVLTDLNITGRVPQISIKDDKFQKGPGGNNEEKNLELRPGTNGHMTFIRDGRVCTINNMYAESHDPNAGTYTNPNTQETSTQFCEKDKNKCNPGACPALVVFYDAAGNPVTTYPICEGKKTCCDISDLFTPGGSNCTANKKGKCRGECPDLFRTKKDASRGANPVIGDCDEKSCNCVYEFITKKDKKRMIPQQQLEGKLKIYPNPVSQQIHIAVSGYEGAYHLRVVNILGQQLITRTIELDGEADEVTLDVSSLANGLYYVVLRNDAQQLGGTFMKE